MRVEIVMNRIVMFPFLFYIVSFHAPDISRGHNSVCSSC